MNTNNENIVDSLNFEDQPNLATRGERFAASLIDGFIGMAIVLPIMYFTGGFENISNSNKVSIEYRFFLLFIGVISFLILNGKLLLKNGQTIGKKILNIKIVTLDGDLPNPKSHLLKRYFVYFFLGHIPVIGNLLSTINLLFIFGKQKRCLHDYAAGTKVVKCW